MPSECSFLSGPGCIALLLPAGRLAAYELAGSAIEGVAATEDRRDYRTKQQCDECSDSHCRQRREDHEHRRFDDRSIAGEVRIALGYPRYERRRNSNDGQRCRSRERPSQTPAFGGQYSILLSYGRCVDRILSAYRLPDSTLCQLTRISYWSLRHRYVEVMDMVNLQAPRSGFFQYQPVCPDNFRHPETNVPNHR